MVFPAIFQKLPPLSDSSAKAFLQPFLALGIEFWEFMTNMSYVERVEKGVVRRRLSLDVPIPGRSVTDNDGGLHETLDTVFDGSKDFVELRSLDPLAGRHA